MSHVSCLSASWHNRGWADHECHGADVCKSISISISIYVMKLPVVSLSHIMDNV